MKRRVTYIHSPIASPDAQLSGDSLSITGLDAAKEERITLGVDEIPIEIRETLQPLQRLHIRWTTEKGFDTAVPFSSRNSPGLSVIYVPREPETATDKQFCTRLGNIFGSGVRKCSSPKESFTKPLVLSEGATSSATLQYHTLLPSLADFVAYLQNTVCESTTSNCASTMESLLSVASLDVDYDEVSQTLTVSAFWDHPLGRQKGWTETITKNDGNAKFNRVEVGLLSMERSTQPEELSLGGTLAVVGVDTKLKPTLFSFPSRHHPLPDKATFKASWDLPTGLHPKLRISLSAEALARPPAPADATCALNAYLTLPSTFFADRYQLSTKDPLFLESHNLVGLRAISGETDLEAPDWVVPGWGSNLLVDLATPSSHSELPEDGTWDATIPLHLRYLQPSPSGNQSMSLPWPVVFWACTAGEGTMLNKSPFDQVNLGWDGLFDPQTLFYQVHPDVPEGQGTVEDIHVPVLRVSEGLMDTTKRVELGTMAVIGVGFLWILWKLLGVVRSNNHGVKVQKTE